MASGGKQNNSSTTKSDKISSVGGAVSLSNFGGGLGPLGGGLGPLGGGLSQLSGNNLEMRLKQNIENERKHQLESDTKLKAIETAANYEDFRQMVMGSHLRPLERSERSGSNSSKQKPSIWNSLANSASKRCGGMNTTYNAKQLQSENSPYPASDVHYDLQNLPNTTEGLVQLWGRLDLADRLDLVRGLGGGRVDKLAGGLVAGGLLGDAITTLLAFTPTPGDVVMVVALLHALTQAKRFSLSVQLVCGEERWAWGRLLEKLQLVLSDRPQDLAELNVTEWTIVQLKAKFNL